MIDPKDIQDFKETATNLLKIVERIKESDPTVYTLCLLDSIVLLRGYGKDFTAYDEAIDSKIIEVKL